MTSPQYTTGGHGNKQLPSEEFNELISEILAKNIIVIRAWAAKEKSK